jgi:ribosome-associated translation inhibitor RaiA
MPQVTLGAENGAAIDKASQPEPTMTEIVDGPVAAADRIYALDEMHSVCRAAPRAVRRVRMHLSVKPQPTNATPAAADCLILVDGALIICAGAVASTTHDAVDGLTARLRRRIQELKSTRTGAAGVTDT